MAKPPFEVRPLQGAHAFPHAGGKATAETNGHCPASRNGQLFPPAALPVPLSRPRTSWYDPCKPVADFVLALLLFLLTLPLLLLAALLVKLTSRGPALYTQIRVGKNGRLFTIYKLRTMYFDSEAETGA